MREGELELIGSEEASRTGMGSELAVAHRSPHREYRSSTYHAHCP